ncbi:MAG TPA: dihydropyrimidinase [Kiritimatiellae bacterium]|nr:dihydropyrimidinase [Kiritimatiellia bacterium]
MKLLVRNGRLVTDSGTFNADILCRDGRIVAIRDGFPPLSGCETVDASGMLVFPGFVDPHVHVYLPAAGTFATDDHITASRAALLGGTTSFIEFVIPARDQSPGDALRIWSDKARDAICDYSFHMAVTRFDKQIASELDRVVEKGITSLKVHLAYHDELALPDAELYELLEYAAQRNLTTIAHCENAEVIELRRKRLHNSGKRAMRWHYESRPPLVERDGTHHFLCLAALTGARAYVAHLSCRQALDVAMEFRRQGYPVFVETLIQFLLLDRSYTELPPEEAVKYVMSPPLRNPEDRHALWTALSTGSIDTVGTDHAPFNLHGQKDRALNDFTRVPNGLPGIQDRIRLLYTHGVCPYRISLNRMVEIAAAAPAKIFGLYPRKGSLQIGSDADLVIFDPAVEETISASRHAMKVDYSPYEGWKVKGRISMVILRGRIAVREGQVLLSPGYGHFIPRPAPSLREPQSPGGPRGSDPS